MTSARTTAASPAEAPADQAAFLRLVVDSAPDAMIVVDQRGRILFANARAEEMFGYPHRELLDQSIEVLVPEAVRGAHERQRHDFQRRPRVRPIHAHSGLVARRKDGTEFQVEISLNPVETPSGVLVCSAIRDVTSRRHLEHELARAREEIDRQGRLLLEARYETLYDSVPVGLFRTSADGRIVSANATLARMLGFATRREALGASAVDFYADPTQRARLLELLQRDGLVHNMPITLRSPDGRDLPVELSAVAEKDERGRVTHLEGSIVDVSERTRLEAQLTQAQKMEAVGLLAGGIAHDFNNLLGAITVFAELAMGDMAKDDVHRADLDSIREAVQRATTLTRQLLAFSRQQVLRPRVLDPNAVINDLLKILSRLIGEDIELITELDASAGAVRADPSQLEQVLLNLAVNARDAMPSGGRLEIRTALARLDQTTSEVNCLDHEGDYLAITVTDTGAGMTAEVKARVFEPFFTTKGARGTGLGLATVYGIVRQSGGCVSVESEPGRGAAFTVYLPLVGDEKPDTLTRPDEGRPEGGSETILLAEDDPAVRTAATAVLTRLGYTVLAARTGEEALLKARRHNGPIHLLLSDVVLPGMDGRELVERLRRERATTLALLTSGYAGDLVARHGVTESGIPFLEKPFTSTSLAARVREVLDSAAS